ncbi:hypothetical protein [Rickettsia endosymbiont of Aspidapion aeneum]
MPGLEKSINSSLRARIVAWLDISSSMSFLRRQESRLKSLSL